MDQCCENCVNWDEDNDFCEELEEITHALQSCDQIELVSQCCKAEVDEDIMICPVCKEHC